MSADTAKVGTSRCESADAAKVGTSRCDIGGYREGGDVALRCPRTPQRGVPTSGLPTSGVPTTRAINPTDRTRLCRARGETRQTLGGSTEFRPAPEIPGYGLRK